MPLVPSKTDELEAIFEDIQKFSDLLVQLQNSTALESSKGHKVIIYEALCKCCVENTALESVKDVGTSAEQVWLFAASLDDTGPDCERAVLLQSAEVASTVVLAAHTLSVWDKIGSGLKNKSGNQQVNEVVVTLVSSKNQIAKISPGMANMTLKSLSNAESSTPLSQEDFQTHIAKYKTMLESAIASWTSSKVFRYQLITFCCVFLRRRIYDRRSFMTNYFETLLNSEICF